MKNPFLEDEYRARVNKAMDYIEGRLTEELTLEEIAAAACFSKYHFHRIFRTQTGETLGRFIQRLRSERAADRIANNPRLDITEVAMDFGFSSPAVFSRVFKERFGITASAWRDRCRKARRMGEPSPVMSEATEMAPEIRNIGQEESNDGQTLRKEREVPGREAPYPHKREEGPRAAPSRRNAMFDPKPETRIEKRGAETLAYVRHVGPYQGNSKLFGELFGKLDAWAGPRGFIGKPETRWFCIYHDNPDVTDDEKLRTSVCLTVPEGTEGSGEVGIMPMPAGPVALTRFVIREPKEYAAAWDFVYGEWLPRSGYQPDDRPCFEEYPRDPEADESGKRPDGSMLVDIGCPVKPL